MVGSDTPQALAPEYKWTAMIVASLGTLLGVLNASTLIIALPTMMVSLNTDLIGVTWVLISYMLLITILAPACGRLADIYGRKNIYIAGLAIFTFGSLLCGVSAGHLPADWISRGTGSRRGHYHIQRCDRGGRCVPEK